MDKIKIDDRRRAFLMTAVQYLAILLGCAIFAAGFQFFLYPNDIVSGGVVGISMIINRLTGLPVGVMTIVLNVPLFLIAWRRFGAKFIVSSLVGMLGSSILMDTFGLFDIVLTNDPMLGSIMGGALKGAGLGLVYYVGATSGGMDIVAKLLRSKVPHINMGTILLCLDAAIVVSYALLLKRYESAMYSVIAMFVVSKVIDLALYGFDNSCICFIISEKSKALCQEIIQGRVHRGVTILDGEGAYSGRKKKVIMCVIKRTQIAQIRRVVKSIDQDAFFIVTDAKNVFGRGFDNINQAD